MFSSTDVTLTIPLRWHVSVFVLKGQVNISQVYYLLPLDINGSPGDD